MIDITQFKAVPVVLAFALACETRRGPAQVVTREPARKTQGNLTVGRAIDWYPLVKGSVWEYRVSKESVIRIGQDERTTSKPGTVLERCLGSSPDEKGIQLLHRRIEEHNPRLSAPVILSTVQRLSVTDDSITALSIQQDGHAITTYEVPFSVFSFKVTSQRTTRTIDALQLDVAQESQSTEGVQVPAGNYPDAIKRVTSGAVAGKLGTVPIEGGTVVETTWFDRGIGPVKVERRLDVDIGVGAASGKATEVTVRVLLKFAAQD